MRKSRLIALGAVLSLSCRDAASPEAVPRDTTRPEDLDGDRHPLGTVALRWQDGRVTHPVVGSGLVAEFDDEGLVVSRSESWDPVVAVTLEAWGREGGNLQPSRLVKPHETRCTGPRASRTACSWELLFDRGPLAEWWVPGAGGIEQGWTLRDAPAGDGPLQILVRIDGLETTGSSTSLRRLHDAHGRAWQIDAVAAWDADGVTLPARASFDGARLAIQVDDTHARYPVHVDPIYTPESWTLIGGDANFSKALAYAGDVNGDGFGDAIIGAEGLQMNSGRAYVFLGSASGLASEPAAELAGGASAYFGQAVAGVGDVNGDGYDDVAVGAYQTDEDAGAFYVYHGSASGTDETPATTVSGATGAGLGLDIAGAGDVNRDGYADVIVGTSDESSAYIFHGSASGIGATAVTTLTGPSGATDFGQAVAGVGDVNGDGYDDVAVGDPGYSSNAGRAHFYHGAASGVSTSASRTLTGSSSNRLGNDIDGAGDTNADGYDDVLVGRYGASSWQGMAGLYRGSSSGVASSASTTFTGPSASSRFGGAVAGLGDVNGDGYDDIAIGAPGYDSYAGRVEVYHGSSSTMSSTPRLTLTGSTDSFMGNALGGGGDYNGDGSPDLLTGAYAFDDGAGEAYVFAGSSTGIGSTASTTLSADTPTVTYPRPGLLGDVNGDGWNDLAVGMPAEEDQAGTVDIYYGSATGPSDEPDLSFTGSSTSIMLGTGFVAAGDVDGDGIDDAIVLAWAANSYTGAAYLHLGSSSGLDATATTTLSGSATSDWFGLNATPVGDTDGDGYSDVVIGAPYAGTGGEAYLFRGSAAGLSSTPATTWSTTTALASLGYTVRVGDFNGDADTDLAIGAPGFDSSAGRVLVYHGSATGISTTATTTLRGGTAGIYFGGEVEVADFNGDGFDDLAAQAWGYARYTGQVSIFEGSSSGLGTTATATYEGVARSDYFGKSLAAGDFGGDGYADLAVSSTVTWDSGPGRIDLFEGSASGLSSTADQTMEGEGDMWYLGYNLDAGDFDGDGYDDLVAGGAEQLWLFSGYGTDSDGDGYGPSTDCDDTDASVNPGAAETCDGTDNDCNGTADDGVTTTYFLDADGDGYGDNASTETACAAPSGYVATGGDCDDSASSTSPAAAESCDGFDNDCDGDTDESGALGESSWYLDGDADGYGDASAAVVQCNAPSGYVSDNTDCDDATASVNPGSGESCNEVDDNCDGTTDEGVLTEFFVDTDGDGFGGATAVEACSVPAGAAATGGDCDDGNGAVSPGASETCNGQDDNCDGSTDEGVLTTYFVDADGDGFGTETSALACEAPAGYAGLSGDCDDTNALAWPGGVESCNGIDDDCDGATDESGADGESAWFLDADGDGYGNDAAVTWACARPDGHAAGGGDCDDANADTSPSAVETCNEIDDDCDLEIDEGLPNTTWYDDADGDGFGDPATAEERCGAETGEVPNGEDCDDDNPAVGACDDSGRTDSGDGTAEDTATPGPNSPSGKDAETAGCGCTTAGPGATGLGLGLLAAALGRRYSLKKGVSANSSHHFTSPVPDTLPVPGYSGASKS